MAQIAAAMVKELREKTGAGMMDCKGALAETDGDMEAAIDWLRTKGLAKAAKKASRVAAEGLIGVATQARAGALVEVNSETDFVGRNESFQAMVREIAKVALATHGDVDALKAAEFPGVSKSVADHVTDMVASIGENMSVRRCARLKVNAGVVASYVHNQVAGGLGKIGVLVALESNGDADKLTAFGRQLAMHVAAASPLALTPDDIDETTVERERAVYTEQARESGKPENIIEKMVEGRMRKFYEESVLLSQVFVIDGESKVSQAVEAASADVGSPVALTGFVRMEIGEGITREEDDFAAEVAKAASGG